MQIPKRLAYILERDQQLDGAIKLSISQFEPWIKHSNLPFFPEYTKHDIEHIESVLCTAVALIRNDALDTTITAGDAAVLILGILLHDCAMHLSEDGFFSLLESERSKKLVPGMGDKQWNFLWEDFIGEASRFDGRKLTRLFGDAQPIRRPPTGSRDLTQRDRLLIGEFLRRHHPRLAQEIALYGVPTKGRHPLVLQGFSSSTEHIVGLAGIVARSHGSDVRAFLPYIQREFNDFRQFRGVHAVFLMSLLRVSDYLQIEADRAPSQVLQVKCLSSPVSEGEWKAHAAIRDVRNTHEDPESLFIDAFPDDVHSFLKVESWLRGIQRELDASWAVLGEVYGRYGDLNRLGFVLRRVRSSLDDTVAFSKKVAYLPKKAVFRAADADLLKLLIEPLYGNHPEVGLRELIQNALDAVRELRQYQKDVPASNKKSKTNQDADVVVSVEKEAAGQAWVTISDNGIGMTPQIITEYFLTAGASFRRSEDWKKTFEVEGKSKVLRAGRFGVGALASFLIGPEIEVATRHIDEIEGIEFKASVESDSIELRKVDRSVGTTIRIRITQDLARRLGSKPHGETYYLYSVENEGENWDWYSLSDPSLKRIVFGKELKVRCAAPSLEEKLGPEWRKTSHPDYAGILWTYSKIWGPYAPQSSLICNGIKIYETRPPRPAEWRVDDWEKRFGFQLPHISVFDPDGRLPLNLQRTDLAEKDFPFDDALVSDIAKDFIAFALVNGPTSPPKTFSTDASIVKLAYPGSTRVTGRYYYVKDRSEDWYFTNEGFGYLAPSVLKARGFASLFVARIDGGSPESIGFLPQRLQPAVFLVGDGGLLDLDGHIRHLAECGCNLTMPQEKDLHWTRAGFGLYPRTGLRFLVSDKALSRGKKKGAWKLTLTLQSKMKEEWEADGWHLIRMGDCPHETFDFLHLIKRHGKKIGDNSVFTEIYLDQTKPVFASPIATKCLEILRGEIPFDLKLRRKKLQHAYGQLKEFINAHETLLGSRGKSG
ncbi:MAG TPA: ATP-binding protein [Verrucomicrobiae bacterium]|nr:ATP-binding protein [Verrucomicrobiae bacterium]